MSNKLFVGGLPWATDSQALQEAFDPHGEVVEAKVITDRETGRSRGFGFVTYATEAEAEKAAQAMDGQELGGRTIRCEIAREGGGGRGPRRY